MKVSKISHFGQTGSDGFSPSSGKFTGRCGFIVRSWMTMNPTRKKISNDRKQFEYEILPDKSHLDGDLDKTIGA